MKAYAIKSAGVVEVMDINEPVTGSRDVLIDVQYVGLCGSDLNAYRGLMPLVTFPRIPGHEISGLILSKGSEVPETLKVGDRVTVSPYTHCGYCPACRQGRFNTCEFNQTLGVQRDGALKCRISIPFEKVYVSNNLSLEELVLVEPLSVGYHASNRGKVKETDSVLIIGCGTIGMGALCASLRKGAIVIALDIDDAKLEHAKKFGAHHVINSSKENVKKAIEQLTNNEGVSMAIEAAGLPATYRLAMDVVAYAGRIVYIGYSKSNVEMDTQQIVRKELSISGSRNALHVFPSVINMLERREKKFTDMITRIFPFNQSAQAFKYWHENPGKTSKILIHVKE